MGKRIAIATIGTLGDVRPFVALAVSLKKRGYDVTIGTTDDFEPFVRQHGFDFHSLGDSIQSFLSGSQFDNAMSRSALRYAPALLRDGQKILRDAARFTLEMARTADALVVHMNTAFGVDIGDALGIPVFMTVFQPLNPTSEFPYCAYDGRVPDDPLFNRLSYLVLHAQQAYYDLPRSHLRTKMLGLRGRRKNVWGKDAKSIPTLHAYSAYISPAPADWPDTAVITGFWRLDDADTWEPSPEFQAFLDAGEAPIYLGFGSMPFGAQRNTEIIGRALQLWGGRAVIGKGWGGVRTDDLPDTIFAIPSAPHTRLFPLMRAVVHHGGAGTTYAGLYAGRPTMCVPQFFDQPYWGQRVYELGCGPRPVKIKKLSPSVLATALDDLSTNMSYRREAEAIAQRMHVEDGTGRAADVIEETLDEFDSGGDTRYGQPELMRAL